MPRALPKATSLRPRPMPAARQRGAAIVTALLVVTLATIVVSGLFWREHVTIRSVENRLAIAQTRWIERAAIDWAKVILRADRGNVDHLGEAWAVPVAETRLDETVTAGAKISDAQTSALLAGQMFDAQARLNLNNLSQAGLPSQKHVAALRKLLSVVGKPESLADLVLARLQQSQTRVVDGKSVAPAALPMLKVADLRTVAGFDDGVIAALEPFVVFLPRQTTVNVNTAPAEVIAAVAPPVDLASAKRLVSQRERTFFADLTQADRILGARADGSGSGLDASMLSVGSNYFLVVGVIRYDRVEAQTETLLEKNQGKVDVVWQRRS